MRNSMVFSEGKKVPHVAHPEITQAKRIKTLVIEGLAETCSLDQNCWKYLKNDPYINGTRIWLGGAGCCECPDNSLLRGFDACKLAIESGNYHCIVVVQATNVKMVDEFHLKLGSLIKRFVFLGGVVAFPSSQLVVLKVIKNLFERIAWTVGRSYSVRTEWGICLMNKTYVQKIFGRDKISSLKAKCVGLRNVPIHERCFEKDTGVQCSNVLVSKEDRDSENISTTLVHETSISQFDVSIAIHNHGDGSIAYFGDAHFDKATISRISKYIRSRSPNDPICFGRNLSEQTFAKVIRAKINGDTHFKLRNIKAALSSYKVGITKYGDVLGPCPVQKQELAGLLESVSLCLLKMRRPDDALESAERALDLDPGRSKCLFQAAVAYQSLARRRPDLTGFLAHLVAAKKALEKIVDLPDYVDAYEFYKKLERSIQLGENRV
mmetsp:Transcript_3863/g.7311  ORF Transcript_3863/g.7311 Transcript_3863/m.7311 type:complete len:436 (+) Transcript_3863:229-1536(+)